MFIDENNPDIYNSKRDDKPKENLEESKAENPLQSENSIQNPTEVIEEPSQKDTPPMSGAIPVNPVERYIENQKIKDEPVKINYTDRLVGTIRSSSRYKIPIKVEFGIMVQITQILSLFFLIDIFLSQNY